jgi:hypothetical protein
MSLPSKHSHGKKHRSDKDKSSKHRSKDKGKANATLPSTTTVTAANDSPFLRTTSKIRLSIPPAFASDLRRGVEEMLDSMVMRYASARKDERRSSHAHFLVPLATLRLLKLFSLHTLMYNSKIQLQELSTTAHSRSAIFGSRRWYGRRRSE